MICKICETEINHIYDDTWSMCVDCGDTYCKDCISENMTECNYDDGAEHCENKLCCECRLTHNGLCDRCATDGEKITRAGKPKEQEVRHASLNQKYI